MAPTCIHTIPSREDHYDPSLAELFLLILSLPWLLLKYSVIGLSVFIAFRVITAAVICVFLCLCICVSDLIRGQFRWRMREIAEWSKERIWHLRETGLDWMWEPPEGGSPGEKAGAVEAEELRRLDSHDGGGRKGSVGWETSLDEEAEVEDENGQESKKEGMEPDSKDYTNGDA